MGRTFGPFQDAMPHECYEGACASKLKKYNTLRGLRTHQHRYHPDTLEEETLLGKARSLKRKRDAEDEEERQRRDLEAQLAFEAANRTPEPLPVRINCYL